MTTFSYEREFAENFQYNLKERKELLQQGLCGGEFEDFAQYQRMVGQYQELEQLQRDFEQLIKIWYEH